MKTAEHTNGPLNQVAEQTIRPLNDVAEKPELQNEKERLRAAIKDAEEKAADVFDEYQKKLEELPDSPWPEEFLEWMRMPEKALEFHQRTAGLGQAYRIQQCEQYFREWAELPEAKKLAAPRIKLLGAVEKLEAESLAKRKPLDEAIDAARQRLRDLEEEEERSERREHARQMHLYKLWDEIGGEIAREINLGHPDFDRATYEAVMQFKPEDEDRGVILNAILFGPPGCGKSRTMAAWAQSNITPYGSSAWITGADFAALVTALSDNEEKPRAKARLRELAEVDFLFFDDIGSAHFTEARVSHFFALVDFRHAHVHDYPRPTMFTTNHGLQELRSMLACKGGKDATMLAGRIIRRMIGTKNDPRAEFFHFKRRRNAAH